MRTLEEIIKELPEEIRLPIYEAFEAFQKEIIHRDLQEIKEEIRKVWQAIDRLTKAQKKSEERLSKVEDRLTRLERTVQELAEAQKRTEQRVNELAEAQKKSEERLTRLERTVQELAEAQKKSEERLSKVEDRLTRLERTVQELAEALKKLTESHYKLVEEHKESRRQLGGLSMTVGYSLENEAFKALPRLLKEDFGIEVKGRLRRRFVRDKEGEYIEVNIVGKGRKDGKEIVIIGEGKVQLSKRGVDGFIRKKLKRLEGVYKEEIFPVLVTHMVSGPDVEKYVKEKGIALYYSYDF